MSKEFNPGKATAGFNLRSAVVIAGSLFLLFLTIRNSGIRWSDIVLSKTQFGYFVAAIGVFIITIYAQSIRAKILWEPWFDKKRIDTFFSLTLGNFYNSLLPGNLGEGVRAWHFARRNGVSFTRSLASIGVEKYVDAVGFIIYVCIVLLTFPASDNDAYMLGAIALVLFILVLYVVIISFRQAEKLMGRTLLSFAKIGRWLYKLHYNIRSILKNFTTSSLVRYVIGGTCLFLLNIVQYYLVMHATGLQAPIISVHTAFLVSVAMVVIAITPAAPGNIGVLHYGIYSLLILVARAKGIEPDKQLLQSFAVYTIYLHLSYFVPEVLTGLIVLIKERKWLV